MLTKQFLSLRNVVLVRKVMFDHSNPWKRLEDLQCYTSKVASTGFLFRMCTLVPGKHLQTGM